jgi:hypothetical protein
MKYIKKFNEELEYSTLKSAADKSREKGYRSRATSFMRHAARDIIGKTLIGNIITDVVSDSDNVFNIYFNDSKLEVVNGLLQNRKDVVGNKPPLPETGNFYIYYNIFTDMFSAVGDEIKGISDRKGAVMLAKIAKTLNPDTKITPHSFIIKEYM